ncbi:MAG: hypothetical protein ACI865_001326 [Flavobacteriaceae bacterium]|jgi:hypothetical protein
MASGFIELSEEVCFSARWAHYDLLLELIIEELKETSSSLDLVNFLETHLPPEDLAENLDMGWGFIDARVDGITTRILELQKLSEQNQFLFWNAVESALETIIERQSTYVEIVSESFIKLLELNVRNKVS